MSNSYTTTSKTGFISIKSKTVPCKSINSSRIIRKASPYKFESEKVGQPGDKINTRYTGEYVSYGNVIYRIIDGNLDGSAKVISTSVVSDNSVGYSDTDKSKIYNPTKKGNVGYYIENELSKSIKKDIFIKKEIEVPIYDKLATYSGKKNVKKYKVSLAAPDMYECFLFLIVCMFQVETLVEIMVLLRKK